MSDAGKEFNIGPIGLGARDTLRLEMGFCLYGHDIDQTTNPLEAGLSWIVKLDKGEFIGSAAVKASRQRGLQRKLVGFMVNDKAYPRQGYSIRHNGSAIGAVTSGMFSPVLEKSIGMGYVSIENAKIGVPIEIMIRDKGVPAAVAAIPFIVKK